MDMDMVSNNVERVLLSNGSNDELEDTMIRDDERHPSERRLQTVEWKFKIDCWHPVFFPMVTPPTSIRSLFLIGIMNYWMFKHDMVIAPVIMGL
jgi:hypothetical protein